MRRGPRFWELWVLPCLTHLPIFSYFLGSPRSIHLYSGFQILFFILNSILDHFGPYFDIWSPLKSHIFLMKPPWLYLKSLVLSPDPTINPWQWPLAATPPHELFIFGFQLLGKTIRTAVCIWITVNHVYVYISISYLYCIVHIESVAGVLIQTSFLHVIFIASSSIIQKKPFPLVFTA
jgi:hypothetical protein